MPGSLLVLTQSYKKPLRFTYRQPEIAIKSALGKIDVDAEDMVRAIELSGFIELPVAASHASSESAFSQ